MNKNQKIELVENKIPSNESLVNQQNLNSNNIQALQQSLNQAQISQQLQQQAIPVQTVQQPLSQTQQIAIIQTPSNNSLALLKQQNILNLNYQNPQTSQQPVQQINSLPTKTQTTQSQQPVQQQIQQQQTIPQTIQQSIQHQSQHTPVVPSQQVNQYLDPSKFLVQNQYQVSMEIQNLLNSIENIPPTSASSLQLTNHHQTHSLLQQNLTNQMNIYPQNQVYGQNQMHLQNLTNITNPNDYVDMSMKHPNQTIHQSLLQNALLSQFLNQNPLIIPKQQHQQQQQPQTNLNNIQRTTRIVNNVTPLNMQPLQSNIQCPMSAPVLSQGNSSKTTSPSNNSVSISNQIAASQIHQIIHQKMEQNDYVNQSDIEQKPLYSSVVAHNTNNNCVPLNENIGQNIQNLIKTQTQQQQQQLNNSSSIRKQSYIPDSIINQSGAHLNETANDQDLSISNLNLEDLKSAHIQNVLNLKLDNQQNNDILGQLGERIKYLLSEKVLENQNQMNEYQTNVQNQSNHTNPIHHNPHQQHLNESMGTYSPSLSRRNSVDLKEKQLNSVKQVEQTKSQVLNYGIDQADGTSTVDSNQQLNENNLAQFIMNLVNSNQLQSLQQQSFSQSSHVQSQPLYQHQNTFSQQTQNQLISAQQQSLNQAQIQNQISGQQLQQQQFLNQPSKQVQQAQQLNTLNESYNLIENQNRNLASLQASLLMNTINRSNLEELFTRFVFSIKF